MSASRIMGVVNVTPDSFSDGGRYLDAERAIAHGLELAAEGAEILDVGGESTRPGAAAVSAPRRSSPASSPVIAGLRRRLGAPVSIDTSKAAVAEAALDAGADDRQRRHRASRRAGDGRPLRGARRRPSS